MGNKKQFFPVLGIFLILGLIWFVGCATSGKSVQGETQVEDVADIDELLGLADKKLDEGESETIAEDDVLRLLGVFEEGESTVSQPTGDEGKTRLEEEVQALEAERTALETKEKSLREQVSRQESEIQDKEETAPVWRTSSFSERYQEALQDYRSHQYRRAIPKFQAILNMNMKHHLSDNCQYWIGEAYYGLGNYRQAIVAFEKVFSFVNSNKDDAAQLKLGLCYMRLKDRERARKEFQILVDNYPTSEYRSIARRFIAQIEQ